MALFKRKKEVKKEAGQSQELPKLPELPRLPELPNALNKLKPGELPSKPPEAKPAGALEIGNLPSSFGPENIGRIPPLKEKRTLELSETTNLPGQLTPTIPQPSIPMAPTLSPKLSKKVEPVYIRIDKFKSAVNSFQEIQNKIREIESLLTKIREQKQKEDEELREWEREIETIKARMGAIDQNIFSKLD